jgi:molecular chaperone GrpE (heat shock protein)
MNSEEIKEGQEVSEVEVWKKKAYALSEAYSECQRKLNKIRQIVELEYKQNNMKHFIEVIKDLRYISLSMKHEKNNLNEALKMINAKVDKILETLSITEIVPKIGDIPDVKTTHIISKMPSENQANKGRICDVLSYGYMIDGVVIQPANVVVYD